MGNATDWLWLALVIVLALNLPLAGCICYLQGYNRGLDRAHQMIIRHRRLSHVLRRGSSASWAYPWPTRTEATQEEATDGQA
jgi:hypothetical protein